MDHGRIRAAIAAVGVIGGILLGTNGAAAAGPDSAPGARLGPVFRDLDGRRHHRRRPASGAHYFTLAFLETTGKSSCTLAWDGSRTQTVAAGRYLADIASLRAMGGDVIPSFGGWSADQGGTEIGDSCKDVD